MKQLLLDLRDAVKYWRKETRQAERRLEEARTETARQLDAAAMENLRVHAELEATVKFNEDRGAMFVQARTEVANLQAQLQNADQARVQLEKQRKMLFGALVVCLGLVVASCMPWSM